MTDEVSQKTHQGAGHTRHFDEKAEKHEQRNGEQNQVAHALVHAADQHRQRGVGGQSEIAENRKAEGKCDRHARKHRRRDHTDKENQQVEIPQAVKQRGAQPEQRDHDGDYADR